MEKKALVGNAADAQQVKEAGRKDRERRKRELEDLKSVLTSLEGRRFIWRLLGHCKVFESIWHPSAQIHHSAGKQDVGHFIMAEVVEADQEAFLRMMQEAKIGNGD